jgi:hypothetical protein
MPFDAIPLTLDAEEEALGREAKSFAVGSVPPQADKSAKVLQAAMILIVLDMN